jgi:carboxyl-terminal processing protease
MIVYLSGLKTPRQEFISRGNGDLADSRIIILVDEGSASASEILAGAMQDYDRGVVVGRRTFGKGLVQNGFYMQDGSMVRLTIARYYTPTGRLIQRPYEDGLEKYIRDYYLRFSNGELISADSISFPDSLKYKTLVNGRDVFGGGGIMPDIFVPVDTSWYSDYYRLLISTNAITEFTLDYVDRNRNTLKRRFKSFDKFESDFEFTDREIADFISKAEDMGAEFEESQFETSKKQLLKVLKGLVARDLWDMSEYYETVNQDDKTLLKALDIISDRSLYNSLLKNSN